MPRRFAIYGNVPAAGVPPFEDAQNVSVDFNGTNEMMGNTVPTAYGTLNEWSVAMWFKPRGASFTQESEFWRKGTAGTAGNQVDFRIRGTIINDPLRVRLYRPPIAASIFKDYQWDSLVVSGEWNLIVITWNGPSDELLLYHNGTLTAPSAINTDEVSSQNNSLAVSQIANSQVGGAWCEGRIHQVGQWDVVLASGEQAVIYNGGNGKDVDWGSDSGSYSSSGALLHWWRLGHDSADMGADSGVTGGIDVMHAQANITSGDIVADAPGL